MTDIDQDISAPDGPEPVKKKLHPGLKRNLLFIVVFFLIAIIATVLALHFVFSGNSDQGQSSIALTPPAERKNDGPTPQYRKLIDEKNQADAKQAAATGGSNLPVMPDRPANTTPVMPNAAVGIDPGVQGQSLQGATAPTQANQVPAGPPHADTARTAEAMNTLINKWSPQAPKQIEFKQPAPVKDVSTNVALTGGVQGIGQQVPNVGSVGETVKPVDYDANLLKPFAATLDKPIRTDIDPLTIATIRSGPYSGAKLQGKSSRAQAWVNMEFTQMIWQGKRYTINAVGLDQETLSAAVSGNYDRELMSRHFIPLAFDLAQGYADARSQVGNQVIASAGGVLQSTPSPTNQQAIYSGLKAGLKDMSTIAAEDKPQPHVDEPILLTIAIEFLN